MNEPGRDYLSSSINPNREQLPNATATLVLGILSIVVCFICGIIALIISNRDMEMYRANPEIYSEASYGNIKAGRICAIVGIALQVIGVVLYIIIVAFIVSVSHNLN